jgi:hypothetical protein
MKRIKELEKALEWIKQNGEHWGDEKVIEYITKTLSELERRGKE